MQTSVGLRIRAFNWHMYQARKRAGLSQAELGERAGLAQVTIGNIETLHSWPSEDAQIRIAIALEMPVDELFPEVLETRVRANRGLPTSLRFEAPITVLSLDDPCTAPLLPAGDTDFENVERGVDREMLLGVIRNALTSLKRREAEVLRHRFGIDVDHEPELLDDVARRFGVTRERIRQIEAKALRRLRHSSKSQALQPFREAL